MTEDDDDDNSNNTAGLSNTDLHYAVYWCGQRLQTSVLLKWNMARTRHYAPNTTFVRQ